MKIYTKIKTYALVLALGSLTVVSCEKDFLDVNPSEVTPNVALSDPDAAPQLVNSIYNIFLSFDMSSFPWYGITEIASDNSNKGSSPGDTGTYQLNLDEYTFSETEAAFRLLWELHYQGIARANQAIIILPDLEIDEELRTRLMGEAKFLRGLLYFRMVQMFGGVPIIDFIPDPGNEEDINRAFVRASEEEVYAFITADLKEASESLPKKSQYGTRDIGRATRGAALTVLAKVNMYQGYWQPAFDLTGEIIASGEYDLELNYEEIWREGTENGIESIFEIQGRGEEPSLGVNGYYETQGARGQGGWGWGFNEPTEDLVAAYAAEDPRRDATIIFRGETLYDGRLVPETVENPRYNEKAYVSQDFLGLGKNVRLFRYAEVLLMRAEAAYNLGDMVTAEENLNLVRARVDLPANTNPDLEMAIWEERRLELAMENDRMFDLRRQGRAGEVMRAHGKPFVDGKHELYPIPQDQISQSGGLLMQNPGW